MQHEQTQQMSIMAQIMRAATAPADIELSSAHLVEMSFWSLVLVYTESLAAHAV